MIYHYYAARGGWRLTVMFYKGRKWLKLLEVSTFEVYRLPVSAQHRLKPAADLNVQKVARNIARRRALLKRCHVGFSKKAVQAAIAALTAAAP